MTPIDRPLVLAILSFGMTRLSMLFFLPIIILFADCIARMKDYQHIRNAMFSKQLAHRYRVSWCSRGVACFVWGNDARNYYHSIGYRFWHVFPDGAPMCFVNLRFWKGVIRL